MPRYLIQRAVGPVSEAELDAAAEHSAQVREEQFPQVTWEHSHVVRTPEGLVTYCVYGAPDEQAVRDHATAAGLPADVVQVIEQDIVP